MFFRYCTRKSIMMYTISCQLIVRESGIDRCAFDFNNVELHAIAI